MSALGHFLEDEGLATTIVSLVRLHSENIAPPRSLWVEYEFGRPFGPPNDSITQRRVLEAALALLESDDGPSVIADFDSDDDGTTPDGAWRNPVELPAPDGDFADADGARESLLAEISLLAPQYAAAVEQRGRTSVGLSGLNLDDMAAHLTSFLGGEGAAAPRADMSKALLMRFAADDLKAYYMEAAAVGPGRPSSAQLNDWFWRGTVAGRIMIALRAAAAKSEDKGFNTVGSWFLVPNVWVDKLGL